jgi:hypothetical protein
MDLRRLLERFPRLAGVRFRGTRTVVLIDDGHPDPLTIALPAGVRGRLVVSLEQLVELEVERPIVRDEVAPSAAAALLGAIERHHAMVDAHAFWEQYIETAETTARTAAKRTQRTSSLTSIIGRRRRRTSGKQNS